MFKTIKDLYKLMLPYFLVIGGMVYILYLIHPIPLEDVWLIAKTFLYILSFPFAVLVVLAVYDLAVMFWDRGDKKKDEED